MSAFNKLKEASINFEQQLRAISSELFCVKSNESFEDGLAKYLEDIKCVTSKQRLLKARIIAAEATDHPQTDDDPIQKYEDIVEKKVLEQALVKSVTQEHAVSSLIAAPDESLSPEMLEKKGKILQVLKDFNHKESVLREMESLYNEKEEELVSVRNEWAEELEKLQQFQTEVPEIELTGVLYEKLCTVVNKLEMMRMLISRLVTSPVTHDWLANPAHTGHVLKLARKHYSVLSILEKDEEESE